MTPSIGIIYGASDGNARFVANRIMDALVRASRAGFVIVGRQSATLASAEDLLDGDVLLLVADARGLEEDVGRLFVRAARVDLKGRRVGCVVLGATVAEAERTLEPIEAFIDAHHGVPFVAPLLLEDRNLHEFCDDIEAWGAAVLAEAPFVVPSA